MQLEAGKAWRFQSIFIPSKFSRHFDFEFFAEGAVDAANGALLYRRTDAISPSSEDRKVFEKPGEKEERKKILFLLFVVHARPRITFQGCVGQFIMQIFVKCKFSLCSRFASLFHSEQIFLDLLQLSPALLFVKLRI